MRGFVDGLSDGTHDAEANVHPRGRGTSRAGLLIDREDWRIFGRRSIEGAKAAAMALADFIHLKTESGGSDGGVFVIREEAGFRPLCEQPQVTQLSKIAVNLHKIMRAGDLCQLFCRACDGQRGD